VSEKIKSDSETKKQRCDNTKKRYTQGVTVTRKIHTQGVTVIGKNPDVYRKITTFDGEKLGEIITVQFLDS